MKKILFAVLVSVFSTYGFSCAGQEVLVIQSTRIKPFEEAVKGFKSVCPFRIQRLVLNEQKEKSVSGKIKTSRPGIILAVGMDALAAAKKVKHIPVVYLMVLKPDSILAGEKNITGVSMYIPYEKQLRAFMDAVPDVQTIGLLYDPEKTGAFVADARNFARQINIRLIAKAIHNPKEAPAAIMALKGKIDAFWMLPDVTLITREAVEFLLLFSIENKIPLFTFSEKYVEMGAFMSMDIDAFDMGRQAGEMVLAIQGGEDLKKIKPVYARKAIVATNLLIARKIGVSFVNSIVSAAATNEKVFRETRLIN